MLIPPSSFLLTRKSMASLNPISRSQSLFNKAPAPVSLSPHFESSFVPKRVSFQFLVPVRLAAVTPPKAASFVAATTAGKPKSEAKGFVQEMKAVAVKLHTKEQAKGGEKEVENPEEQAINKWEPSLEGYLKFLVDSKLVYDTFEGIVDRAAYPFYVEFQNTGLERSESLAKDLEWLKEQGYTIPEPSSPGVTYAQYLNELGDKDPPAFMCHFYNVYFAHSAGGRIIGKRAAEMINGKELEFYKWDGDVKQMLQNVRDKLNKVAEGWNREEKDHCLEETEKSFKYSRQLLRLVLS